MTSAELARVPSIVALPLPSEKAMRDRDRLRAAREGSETVPQA